MSDPELTPIVDRNGVHTHRYKRQQPQQPAAGVRQVYAQLPVPHVSTSDDERSFGDVEMDSEVISRSSFYWLSRVYLQHSSGGQAQVDFPHPKDQSPRAHEVLSSLGLLARSHDLDAEQDLHQLLGEDYEQAIQDALADSEGSLLALTLPVRREVQDMSEDARRALEERDVEAYAILQVLVHETDRRLRQDEDTEGLRSTLQQMAAQARYLEDLGSSYGWTLRMRARHLQQVMGALEEDPELPALLPRAGSVPRLGQLVAQMRQELPSMASEHEAQELHDWANDLEQLVIQNASAEQVVAQVASKVRRSHQLGAHRGATLRGYALKANEALWD